METFLQDARQAFTQVIQAATATTAATVDRWLARLPPQSRRYRAQLVSPTSRIGRNRAA